MFFEVSCPRFYFCTSVFSSWVDRFNVKYFHQAMRPPAEILPVLHVLSVLQALHAVPPAVTSWFHHRQSSETELGSSAQHSAAQRASLSLPSRGKDISIWPTESELLRCRDMNEWHRLLPVLPKGDQVFLLHVVR